MVPSHWDLAKRKEAVVCFIISAECWEGIVLRLFVLMWEYELYSAEQAGSNCKTLDTYPAGVRIHSRQGRRLS